jgi:Motility related/secretion protein
MTVRGTGNKYVFHLVILLLGFLPTVSMSGPDSDVPDQISADSVAVVSSAFGVDSTVMVPDSSLILLSQPADTIEVSLPAVSDSVDENEGETILDDLFGDDELDDQPLFSESPTSDTFGFIELWNHWLVSDTSRVNVMAFEPQTHYQESPYLNRLYHRMQSRHLVREEMQLNSSFWNTSDSIAVTVQARVDSLLETREIAAGVLYSPVSANGLRHVMPSLPMLNNLKGRQSRSKRQQWDHSVDLEAGRITRLKTHNGVDLMHRAYEPYSHYMFSLLRTTSREIWAEEIVKTRKASNITGGTGGYIKLELPFELPKSVKSIFGEGRPNLSVTGSERISFGGKSRWFPHKKANEYSRKQSKFPQLEMDQDLTIKLKGSIGDKLDIDIDQSSQASQNFGNRIKIHYRGYEDEIIQKVDLGNTSLRLPGTEYVSYGGKHTGLFGIAAEAQLGAVSLNVIISKEEGESATSRATGSSKSGSKTMYDYEYIRDRFFYLDDPFEDAYPASIDPEQRDYVINILENSVDVYLDDGDGNSLEEGFDTIDGYAYLDLDSAVPTNPDMPVTGELHFEKLQFPRDYWILLTDSDRTAAGEIYPYIILNRYIDSGTTLAITYTDKGVEGGESHVVGGLDSENILHAKMLRPRDDDYRGGHSLDDPELTPWGTANRLMFKNVYNLVNTSADWSGQGLPDNAILKDGFEIKIRYLNSVDGAETPDVLNEIKLIEYTGLDHWREIETGYELGSDGQVDLNPWVDLAHGLLFFPDFRPFAPGTDRRFLRGRPGDNPNDWVILPEFLESTGEPVQNPDIYNLVSAVRDRDITAGWNKLFEIEVNYKTPSSSIRIEAWDIIEGSEVVTAGSRRLSKDSHYRINYQTGDITILSGANVADDEEISVTYKRSGGFGNSSKTLLGAAAFYKPEHTKFNFSTSWLYEKTGSPDRRPKLGSEPTRTAVGEIASSYSTESMGITRLLDKLPGIDARKVSKITVDGGLGFSFPNPNTRNDLYLDDFEGSAEDVYVRLNRRAWRPSSSPEAVGGNTATEKANRRGEFWWYSPRHTVQHGDLNPSLEYSEGNDYKEILECQFFPYQSPDTLTTDFWDREESWGGIVQPLSEDGLDLSRARFLDVWVNDFVTWEAFEQDSTLRDGTLYIELGWVSEDALWKRRPLNCGDEPEDYQILGNPVEPANQGLDSEDQNDDGRLDYSDQIDEDTGLDGIKENDSGFVFDDYELGDDQTDENEDFVTYNDLCERYARINGTEENTYLDTEDLDGDYSIDLETNYYQFRIDLSDQSLIETDVRRDYTGEQNNPIDENNGWRRIRVPLSDDFVDAVVGTPSWTEIKHLRLWVTGAHGAKRIQIGGVEIRSNRWMIEGIRDTATEIKIPDEELAPLEDFYPGVINNKENSDVYYAPFSEHRERSNDSIKEREQSLTLEMSNFQPERSGVIHNDYRTSQDLTGYEFLEFWLNSTVPVGEEADFFIRLCKNAITDTTNYYEYRMPVPRRNLDETSSDWEKIKLRLSDFSDLKRIVENDTTGLAEAHIDLDNGASMHMKGRPRLTNVDRISLGVTNTDPFEPIMSASVWIDELRLTHVLKEPDIAYRVQVRTELSDLASVDFAYRHTGADFVGISGGGNKLNKAKKTSLSTSVKGLSLDRFMPQALGLRMPVSFTYQKNRAVSKYRTESDILVGEQQTTRDVTQSVARSTTVSLSRQSNTKNKLLKYSVNAISLSAALKENYKEAPKSVDSTLTRTFSMNYNAPIDPFKLKLYGDKWQINLLPKNFSAGMARSWKNQRQYKRRNDDLSQQFEKVDRAEKTRTGGMTWGTGYSPIRQITYNFKQSRDLMLKHNSVILGGLNLGAETSRNEDINYTQTVSLKRGWLEPRLSFRTKFTGRFNEQTNIGSAWERYHNFNNSRNTTISGEIPIRKFFGLFVRDDKGTTTTEVEGENGRTKTHTRTKSRGGGRNIFQLKRTTGNFGIRDGNTIKRVRGEPSTAYQLGFSMDSGAMATANTTESTNHSQDWGLDIDFSFLNDISVTSKFRKTISDVNSQGNNTGEEGSTWPDLDVKWGDLARKLRLKRYFKSLKASTSYTRTTKTSIVRGDDTKHDTRTRWEPLLSLDMSLKNGVSGQLRVSHDYHHVEDMSGALSIRDDNSTSFKLTAKRDYKITRDIRIPLKNTVEKVTTTLNMSFSLTYSTNRGESKQIGSTPTVTRDTKKMDVDLTGNYNFTKTISGQAKIAYGESADNKNRAMTSRYVEVKLSARFQF